ncbi:gamma-glutamylcyclotransferase family protein [Pseudofrancisella aestuarii]|uniref:Gamma-glutamylcyclotransferase family protein n=1 Tax=Pseudofrancisella aestuarii TaxID=2670347 RepID=A0ABV9T9N3_9GAMM|nr:gamma-glutamylcyclotransferase family protein [Pseudofrancisella aestuarii]
MDCSYFKKLIYLVFLLSSISYAYSMECHPKVNTKKNNFIVGYGSLINSKSRQKTDPNAKKIYPIMIKNYERLWGKRSNKYKITYLVVIPKLDSNFNAVYYSAKPEDISKTDEREKKYCRYKLKSKDIEQIGNITLKEGDYWIYAKKESDIKKPNKEYPIKQSYIDIFIDGCKEVEKNFYLPDFAELCVKTTKGWDKKNEKDDRDDPTRPLNINTSERKIDTLVKNNTN